MFTQIKIAVQTQFKKLDKRDLYYVQADKNELFDACLLMRSVEALEAELKAL